MNIGSVRLSHWTGNPAYSEYGDELYKLCGVNIWLHQFGCLYNQASVQLARALDHEAISGRIGMRLIICFTSMTVAHYLRDVVKMYSHILVPLIMPNMETPDKPNCEM